MSLAELYPNVEFIYAGCMRAHASKYTEALKHPWILGADWTAERVDEMVSAMDTTTAVIPGNYATPAAWKAKVEELARKAPLGEGDDSDDGF